MSGGESPRGADLLGLAEMTGEEILSLLDSAAEMKRALASGASRAELAKKTVCLLFFEPSTRTMHSFAAAARALSAQVVSFTAGAASSTAKGETLLDTAANLAAIGADVFVVRHRSSGAPERLARALAARGGPGRPCVVNAGDGSHEHPTQALLDLFTLRERFGRLEGLELGIVGDIRHSRVARSNVFGMTACGANVTLVAPPSWMPEGVEALGRRPQSSGQLRISHSLDEVLPRLDAIMALRIQKERLGAEPGPSAEAYAAEYGLTEERMSRAKSGCLVLHPGPVNRGVELAGSVADSPRSLILGQAANGVPVRMAVLARCVRARDGRRT